MTAPTVRPVQTAPAVQEKGRARTAPEADLGWCLGVVLRAYRAASASALDAVPHDHRGYQVLRAVASGEHPSQLALAAHLGIDRTVMTYLLDDLVAAGLVERRLNPADRRQRRIVTTEAGARLVAELDRRVGEAEDAALAVLPAPERETFRTLLRRLAARTALGDAPGDPCDVVEDALGEGPTAS